MWGGDGIDVFYLLHFFFFLFGRFFDFLRCRPVERRGIIPLRLLADL